MGNVRVRLKLPSQMPGCPLAWIQFFNKELDNGPRDRYGDVRIGYINQKLKPWGAKYVEKPMGSGELIFDTQENLLVFMMRWS